MYNPLTCYPKAECNIWLNSTLTEAEFNGTNSFAGTTTCLGNKHISMDTFCIISPMKANHKRVWHLVHWLSPVRVKITILTAWVVWTKVITVVRKNHVVKIWVEALTYYSNLLSFLLICVDVIKKNKALALNKFRHPILWWLKHSGFIL